MTLARYLAPAVAVLSRLAPLELLLALCRLNALIRGELPS